MGHTVFQSQTQAVWEHLESGWVSIGGWGWDEVWETLPPHFANGKTHEMGRDGLEAMGEH